MTIGDTMRLPFFRHLTADGKTKIEMPTIRGEGGQHVYVGLLLGTEPVAIRYIQEQVDPEVALNNLGYYRLGPDGRPINALRAPNGEEFPLNTASDRRLLLTRLRQMAGEL